MPYVAKKAREARCEARYGEASRVSVCFVAARASGAGVACARRCCVVPAARVVVVRHAAAQARRATRPQRALRGVAT